jgi:signal transduction histidine kinase
VADVERANEQLVELNRKRDEFVGVAAHDLRNPVAAIKWVASVLSAGADDPRKDIPRHIAKIQANADFALQLLDDLLDITALEHGNVTLQLRDVDLRELIATSVSLSEHGAFRKGISVVVDVPAGLPPVRCDAYRIEQVLNNLLSNAFKFSHPGTTVAVRARTIDEALEVTVEDQGLGIRPEEISGIFCRFRRTSTRSTGGEKSTGLGLSICKHLIDRHGGTIRVESQLGRGTKVVFTLPAPAERRRAPASPAG